MYENTLKKNTNILNLILHYYFYLFMYDKKIYTNMPTIDIVANTYSILYDFFQVPINPIG